MIEQARTFPHSVVTARCIDCAREFTGPLAIHFIESPDDVAIEILVIDEKRSEQHAIARVEREDVPTVSAPDGTLPRTGTA